MGKAFRIPRPFFEIAEKAVLFGRMIKFSHTAFALPFALSTVVIAHRAGPLTFWKIFWILVTMAEQVAMHLGILSDSFSQREEALDDV